MNSQSISSGPGPGTTCKDESRFYTHTQNLKTRLKRMVDLLRPVWTECNEVALGIHTVPSPAATALANFKGSEWRGAITDKAKHRDNYAYAAPDYWYLRKVISILDPRPDDVVYDLGSGLGRFLCLVARARIRRCVGIELFEPLCREAEKNAASLRGRKTQIDVVCSDVAAADLSDGTIYFMFNPFGSDTMKEVFANIRDSLAVNPRPVRIAYYNSFHADVLRSCGWLEEYHRFHTRSGMAVTFWKNQHP